MGGEGEKKRLARWYFGGLGSAGAVGRTAVQLCTPCTHYTVQACCTHPLDLLKVQLQTQTEGKIGLASQAVKVVRNDGVLALYNGLSASLVRQLTYSTTRWVGLTP